MERDDPGTKWTGKVVFPGTYAENLQQLAESRGLDRAVQWLTRHGEPDPAKPAPRLLLRGVRGLTSDGEPHWLRSFMAELHRIW